MTANSKCHLRLCCLLIKFCIFVKILNLLTNEATTIFYRRLGEIIKRARVEFGVSQEIVAEALGLSRVSIVNIEKGRQKIQIHTLIEIVNYLDIPISDFFENVRNAIPLEIGAVYEKKIIKKANTENSLEVNKLKEFIQLTMSKKEK